MKLSVITLHTVNNYGSALQTYATQTVLERMGHTVEFVDYYRKDNTGKAAVEKALNSPAMRKYEKIWDRNSLTRALVKFPLGIMLKRKRAPMRKFIKERIHLTPLSYYSYEEILNNIPEADIYITGSDQVWNSVWNNGIEKPYFLEYAPEGKRRVAFAASIGRESLDDDETEETTTLLRKYKYISMREKSGVDLLKSLGIDSTLILDPTLMMSGEEWREIAKPIKQNRPFLLIYQLNPNFEMDEYAIKLAKKYDWEILRVSYGYSGRQKAGKCLVCPAVENLLWCLDNAACVLTDSFHATAFSLNLSTDFISILPARFGTRISSILELTGTVHRLLKIYDDLDIADKTINHEKVQEILIDRRKAGMEFLQTALA